MIEASDARIVSALLIGGFFVFLTGAIRWNRSYEGPIPQTLSAIASSPGRWRWIHLWMIAGIIVTLLGLGGLTQLFLAAGGHVYSSFGLLLFSIGALAWLVGVVWRLTVLLWTAQEARTIGTISADTGAWVDWFGQLHCLHLSLAYLSWIALAASIFDTGILADWVGWLGVSLGTVGAVGYTVLRGGPFAPPILAHLYTLIIGVALLVKWG